jgi:GT2 family glycosyltransferase/2-polyprenyl-3-methyl-5-hydroxy-6-metoxy-1,4-benzoquinol methylase/glycosyltransferase involved in cell wall biosynthesis
MSVSNPPQHVYLRSIDANKQDSLSLIAGLIHPGQTILDMGMGSGALGQHLAQRFSVHADGVTLNPAEAELAKSWYRQVHIADLDAVSLADLFTPQCYDAIICADVLEHLKAPEHLLAQCAALLKPGGQLITSVPNVGYCGLLAELIQGEFRYRPEGLLDHTHLRFFTRQSLMRFFQKHGWEPLEVRCIECQLVDSEFKSQFDSLPPAVARHLLSMPDALTYQFVTTLRPASLAGSSDALAARSTPAGGRHDSASAGFTAELFLATHLGYQEDGKISAVGKIGEYGQWLSFDIPASTNLYTALRLDPADRPGFFKLRQIKILTQQSELLWHWEARQADLEQLALGLHQQILFQTPWPLSDDALLFLYGDDPWFTLPVPPSVLASISQSGARLELQAGWPMSADYAQAAVATSRALAQVNTELAQRDLRIERVTTELNQLQMSNRQLEQHLAQAEGATREEQEHKRAIMLELQASRRAESATRRAVLVTRAQTQQLQNHLHTIEASTVFRVTRPLVNLKMKIDRLRQPSPGIHVAQNATLQIPNQVQPLPTQPVDIVVPVYRGLEDTRRCIESVFAANCQTPWRLIVINDCSPEPELVAWLQSLEYTDSRLTLLHNTENLGFVATVNRGMSLSTANDVLLLNSDAEVANDWLDRLQRAAYSAARVATVTPFSNNATICSYPRFCQPNHLPLSYNTQQLDHLFARHLAGQTLAVPTGVGFCMYLRRECLGEVGLFDVDNFGKGYGEENDFCVRASSAGWINLHALDTFVRHAGGISFGDSKSERELLAMETLSRLHPQYEADVQAFVKKDPAQVARMVIDLARMSDVAKPVILNVTHNREGGTLRHIQELAFHLANRATLLRLTPAAKGAVLTLEGEHEAFELHFSLPEELPNLVQTLQSLQVSHLHFQHVLGHLPEILDLPVQLGLTYDCTVHDYYSICPQISLTDHTDHYCQEEGIDQCRKCLQRNPAPDGSDIVAWRLRHLNLLNGARYVIAPSQDAARRMHRYAPTATVCVEPHVDLLPDPPLIPIPVVPPFNQNKPLVVAVLGALSKIKGADVLEAVAAKAAASGAALEFHLLGYAYRNLKTQPKARLTVHGPYADEDLAHLLDWLKPDVVWFPAIWPETYSYTLSACIEHGLPVVAPNIGAFPERLHGRPWTWLCDWQTPTDQWLSFFEHLREHNFVPGLAPQPPVSAPDPSSLDDQDFGYYTNYLAGLPCPTPLGPEQMQQALTMFVNYQPANHPATLIKSSALQAIIRLRATVLLSPLAKLVPMHTQRKVKSWLRR